MLFMHAFDVAGPVYLGHIDDVLPVPFHVAGCGNVVSVTTRVYGDESDYTDWLHEDVGPDGVQHWQVLGGGVVYYVLVCPD